MNKNTPILKAVCAATIMAMGMSAQADVSERYIVTYDSNSQALKKGHEIKAQGKNWFAVELNERGKSALMAKAGFKNIEIDQKRFPMAVWNDTAGNPNSVQVTPYNYLQIQADQLSLQPGQKVCVIDSGIAGMQGATGGQNFDFDWGVISGTNVSGTGNWDADGGPHGTHVAGTIGAADNNIGVIGIAPGVPMHIIKVFDWNGSDSVWAYSSGVAQAALECAAAGANIINMSLGGSGATNAERNTFADLEAQGILSIAAAGNDGNNTPSYPAAYSGVMMIGGVDADDNKYSGSQYPTCATTGRGRNRTTDYTTCVEVVAGGVDVLSTLPSGSGSIASLTVDGSGVASSSTTNIGTVTASTYFMGTAENTDGGANGKVCVIDRGNISFADKINNCGNSGGVGAVVINNEPGMIYMDITGVTTGIPAVGAAFEDRTAIVGSSTATIDSTAGDYAKFTGTSMATPTVAGAAALVWSNNPLCTNEEVREAFRATAEDRGTSGRDNEFGYGIAKAAAANAYLASSCGGTQSNFPPTASFSYSCTDLACNFDGTASSDSDGTIASYAWSFGGSGATASNTFANAGTYSVSLTVTDNEGASDTSTQSVTVTDGSTGGNPELTGSRVKGGRQANLSWSGLNGSNVDVYINGNFNNTTANDNAVSITGLNKRSDYSFQICETGSSTCTNTINL